MWIRFGIIRILLTAKLARRGLMGLAHQRRKLSIDPRSFFLHRRMARFVFDQKEHLKSKTFDPRRPCPGINFRAAIRYFLFVGLLATLASNASAIDFTKQIEPILHKHCLECHGPDETNSEFRVDRRSRLLRGGDSGEPAVVPNDPGTSYLLKLVRHEEPGMEMPPEGSLSDQEIQLLQQWIAEGAATPEHYGPDAEAQSFTHWSFQPVVRPSSADSIDGFIRLRLGEHQLEMSSRATRRVLIRRLYLVMLGYPPSPREVEAFLEDRREDAWQRLVEQVLGSPHYGERIASLWLDLIRFGETHGFETNRERPNAWPFRDWVIKAFNEDKPYDQFVRSQIAGDALGDPMGTGFLVAGPMDLVKGQDPKLRLVQRMNELDDMINTCGTAFLGLTTGCARCHNHKFDPISQKDYYAIQAVFAGVNHADRKLELTSEQRGAMTAVEKEIADLESSLSKFLPPTNTGPRVIAIDEANAEHLQPPQGVARDVTGAKGDFSGEGYTWWKNQPELAVIRYRPRIEGTYRIWLSWGAGFATHTTDARYFLESKSGRTEIAVVNQQLKADASGKVSEKKIWSGLLDAGVHNLQIDDTIMLQGGGNGSAITADTIVFQEEMKVEDVTQPVMRSPVKATHNIERFSPRKAKFVRFIIEATNAGEPCIDELQIFSGPDNLALASRGAIATSSGDFKHPIHNLPQVNDGEFGNSKSWIAAQARDGWVQIELPEVTEIDRIEWSRDRSGKYADRVATRYRIECATTPDQWQVVATSWDRRPFGAESPEPKYAFEAFSEIEADQGRTWLSQLVELRAEKSRIDRGRTAWIGTFSTPGTTHRLYRGEADQPREVVGPDAIAAFTSLPLQNEAPEQSRRVEFAKWVSDATNPLTARVMANRIWQFHFGVGIVDTPSDFGRNGNRPSHPELLDWLAVELMDANWSIKHLHRLILNSQTWQQDNRPNARAEAIDADARLLWRFMPRRLEAEGIRDSILAVSGSLKLDRAGGPGFSAFEVEMENVRHYHPKTDFETEDWRRMIYMTKVRQERDQVFGAFDCPDGSMAVPKRTRSTTPLQALNLLNSRFVVQQAEILAERLQREDADPKQQIVRAWQLCFQREPNEAEIAESETFIQRFGLVQFARAMLNTNEFVFIP